MRDSLPKNVHVDLLDRIFGAGELENLPDPHEVRSLEGAFIHRGRPKYPSNNEPFQAPDSEQREKIRAKVRKDGNHALAFYIPKLNRGGLPWGIYFDVAAMDTFSEDLYNEVCATNPTVTQENVARVAYALVDYHEVEHFDHEVHFARTVERGNLTAEEAAKKWHKLAWDAALSVRKKDPDFREVLATRFEMTTGASVFKTARNGIDDLPMIVEHYKMLDLPHPYALWKTESIATLMDWYRNSTNDQTLTESSIHDSRKRSHNGRLETVPRTYFNRSADFEVFSPGLARAYGTISCKTLSNTLKKEKVMAELGHSFEKGTNHEIKFHFPNGNRPSPLDCHAFGNGPVDQRILKQFVTGSGLGSRDAFINYILKNK